MKARITVMACAVLAITGAQGALAAPKEVALVSHHYSKLEQSYLKVYPKAKDRFGYATVGRNIVLTGFTNTKKATRGQIKASTRRMQSWLAPKPVASAQPQTGPTASSSPANSSVPVQGSANTPTSSGGGGGCNGMSAESGSDGYNAVGGGGKYLGCYQIDVGHYAPGGSCQGLGQDPAGQDQCAQVICRTEGPGAWTNPAGQNPCGKP